MIGKCFNSKKNNELLLKTISRSIHYQNSEPYNKRWHYKWATSSYTTSPNSSPTRKQDPSQLKSDSYFGALFRDIAYRILPGLNCADKRWRRCTDSFNMIFLPLVSLASFQMWEFALGFKILTLIPLGTIYTRIRDKTVDPNLKETYLRAMIYEHEELKKYFKDETTHVMDYNFEYEEGLMLDKFPEFGNKYFQFFNTDTHCCKGYFVLGDLESNVTMKLEIKTMPIGSKNRFMPEDVYFYYDVRAHLNINGEYKEVVLINEEEVLKKHRPFLMFI